MTLRLADTARSAGADAVVDRIDGGSGAGTIKVYTGSQPATTATAPSGTLLLTFTLNDPAFGAASAGVATLDVDPALTAVGAAAGDAVSLFCLNTWDLLGRYRVVPGLGPVWRLPWRGRP